MTGNGTTAPILQVDDLRVDFRDGGRIAHALAGVSLTVRPGERLGIAGEAGSGKSTLVFAIMGYVAPGAMVRGGAVRYRGQDLLSMSAPSLRRLRAGELAVVQQDSMAALDPSLTLGTQLRETPRLGGAGDAGRRIVAVLDSVRLADPAWVMDAYPHELSGDQRQRVAIAMALLGEPRLLLLDEPTTALDTVAEAGIVALLADVCAERDMTVIHVSHDRDLLAATCDRVVVIRDGRIVADGAAQDRSAMPPAVGAASHPPGLAGYLGEGTILRAGGVAKTDSDADGGSRETGRVDALADVGFLLRRGETLAVVGESGSGKSTLGRIVAGLETASGGEMVLDGTDVARIPVTHRPSALRRAVQMIFQDPDASLNPRQTVGRQIGRAVRAGGYAQSVEDRNREVRALLKSVRLDPDIAGRRPRALSAGQKQRVAIACAFAVRPLVIVADEPVSALNASARDAVLDLLGELQRAYGTALLLISHDPGVVRSLADQVMVLYRGRVMEQGRAEVVLWPPSHPYTAMLLDASHRGKVSGEVLPLQAETGEGCPFAGRCAYRIAGTCETAIPPERIPGWEHAIHCHLSLEVLVHAAD